MWFSALKCGTHTGIWVRAMPTTASRPFLDIWIESLVIQLIDVTESTMRCSTFFGPCSLVIAIVVALTLLVSIAPTPFFGLTTPDPCITVAMGQEPINQQLRAQCKWDFEQGRGNRYVTDHRGIAPSTVRRYRKTYEATGDVYVPSMVKTGRPKAIPEYIALFIQSYLAMNPDAYLVEIHWILHDEFGLEVSNSTIGRCILKDLKITRKKIKRIAAERDPELRGRFYIRMSQYEPDEIVFLDETASNERTADRRYGWSAKGTPCEKVQSLKKSKRWSILPAYTTSGYIAYEIFQGSFTQALFNRFVIEKVLPLCTGQRGGRWSVLVMDNAKAHRDPELLKACEEAGVIVEFLPPYSPDFNPIETSFAHLKSWIKGNTLLAQEYESNPSLGGFAFFLETAITGVHPQYGGPDPVALFRHCGYVARESWEYDMLN